MQHTTNDLTIGELVQLFNGHNKSKGKRPATCQWHKSALKQFTDFAGSDNSAATLTKRGIDRYRAALVERGLSPASVNTYLRSLKALLNWAFRDEYLAAPVKVEMMLVDPVQPKPSLTADEFKLLLEACNLETTPLLRLRAKAIVLLMFDTGLRAGELCGARWPDISTYEMAGMSSHYLTIQGGKRGKIREVPLSAAVWQAVSSYRAALEVATAGKPGYLFTSSRKPTEPLTVSGLAQMCRRLARRCDTHANPHKFRRSMAMFWLNESEGDIESLMQVGGWQDRKTVLSHYAKFKTETLIKSHQRFSPLSRI